MSLIFTEQLDKPSKLRSKPSNLLRPIFGALYGFDSTAVATFTTLTIADTDTNAIGADDTITFTVQPSVEIAAGGTLTLTGMQGTQTADNASLTVGGAGAAIFGSSGSWTQSTGTLVLTVAGGQSLPTGSDTVITFTLTNSASVQSGKTVSVSSSTFTTANATGTILNTVATYNVTTRDTEANITASTPSNPSGEVTNAYGTDTNDLYVYDGSTWYIYNNDSLFANTYSVDFDGTNDYMDVGNDSSLSISGALSITAWIYADSLSGFPMIMSKRESIAAHAYQFYSTGNKLNYNNGTIVQSTGTISTGAWTHVGVTFDGSGGVSFYINGSSAGTATAASTNPTNTGAVTIAKAFNGNYFNGKIDELAIFNSALSSSNITSIYNSGVPADISSLNPLGWWRMGDNNGGVGTTITDQGSGGNNGTLTNGPTFSTNVP